MRSLTTDLGRAATLLVAALLAGTTLTATPVASATPTAPTDRLPADDEAADRRTVRPSRRVLRRHLGQS